MTSAASSAPVLRLAPSILSADFARLGEEVRAIEAAGANLITFHPEASRRLDRTLSLIRELGCKAGLVLNPGTSLHCLWSK